MGGRFSSQAAPPNGKPTVREIAATGLQIAGQSETAALATTGADARTTRTLTRNPTLLGGTGTDSGKTLLGA